VLSISSVSLALWGVVLSCWNLCIMRHDYYGATASVDVTKECCQSDCLETLLIDRPLQFLSVIKHKSVVPCREMSRYIITVSVYRVFTSSSGIWHHGNTLILPHAGLRIKRVLDWIYCTLYIHSLRLQAIIAVPLFPQTLQFTVTYTPGCSVFTSRILAVDL
jgi:hypothetical protein